MSADPLILVDTYEFLYKQAHEGYSTEEVAFRIFPDIIPFVHYALYYPVYYYDSE